MRSELQPSGVPAGFPLPPKLPIYSFPWACASLFSEPHSVIYLFLMFKWSPVWPVAAHQSQSISLLRDTKCSGLTLYSPQVTLTSAFMGFRSPSMCWACSGLLGCRCLQAQWGPREQTKVHTPTHNIHPHRHCCARPPTTREQHLSKTMSSYLCAQFHTTGFMLIFSFCLDNPILTARILASNIFDMFVYWLSPHSSQTFLHTGALLPAPCWLPLCGETLLLSFCKCIVLK